MLAAKKKYGVLKMFFFKTNHFEHILRCGPSKKISNDCSCFKKVIFQEQSLKEVFLLAAAFFFQKLSYQLSACFVTIQDHWNYREDT